MKPIKILICLFNGSHVATVRKVANNTGHGTIQVEVRSCNQYGTEVVLFFMFGKEKHLRFFSINIYQNNN